MLTTGSGYWSTASVRRFSAPMGMPAGGPSAPGDGVDGALRRARPMPGAASSPTSPSLSSTRARPCGRSAWRRRRRPPGPPVRLSQLATAKVDLHRAAVAFNPARNEFAVAWRERRSGSVVHRRHRHDAPAHDTGGPVGMPAAISDSRWAIVAQNPREVPDGAGAPGLAYDAATGGYLATSSTPLAATCSRSAAQIYGQRLDGELREVGPDDFRISAGPGLVDANAFPTVMANDGMVVVWRRWIGDMPAGRRPAGHRQLARGARRSVDQQRVRPLRIAGAGRTGDRPAAARHGGRDAPARGWMRHTCASRSATATILAPRGSPTARRAPAESHTATFTFEGAPSLECGSTTTHGAPANPRACSRSWATTSTACRSARAGPAAGCRPSLRGPSGGSRERAARHAHHAASARQAAARALRVPRRRAVDVRVPARRRALGALRLQPLSLRRGHERPAPIRRAGDRRRRARRPDAGDVDLDPQAPMSREWIDDGPADRTHPPGTFGFPVRRARCALRVHRPQRR